MEKCRLCGRFAECSRYTEEKRKECKDNAYSDFISMQQVEIETIKPREFSIKLSDADVKRIYNVAGAHGLTPGELIEQFIGDLVDGTYSNGSDERERANSWLERCWFGMFPEYTFLRYLVEWGEIEYYLDDLDDLETAREELEYLQGEEYAKEEPDEEIRNQEIKDAKEWIKEAEERIQEYYNEYKESADDPEELEKAMQGVKKWSQERKKTLE